MPNLSMQSFLSAQFAGQQLNAELEGRKADTELKQQQVVQARNSAELAAQQQAQSKAQQAQMAGIMAKFDTANKAERVETGLAPDEAKFQEATKTADMYEQMGKVSLVTSPEVAQGFIKLAHTARGQAAEVQTANLQKTERVAKTASAYAGTVLEGLQTDEQAFEYVARTEGTKAAMEIPKDPVAKKVYWESKQSLGRTDAEKVAQIGELRKEALRKEEKKEALEQRRIEDLGRREDRAASRELARSAQAIAAEARADRKAGVASDREFRQTEKLSSTVQAAAKPILSDLRNVELVQGLLKVNTSAGDQQIHQALTSLSGELKGRATNLYYKDNARFGSLVDRLGGMLSKQFAGRYSESDRVMIQGLVKGMKNDVLEPALAGLESGAKAKATGYGLDPGNVEIAGDFNRGAKAAKVEAAAKAPAQYTQGQVAVNPTTGAKMMYQNGKWVAI